MERYRNTDSPDLDDLDEQQSIEPGLADLAPESAARIRLFIAERAVKGGSSPADIADLYTAPEIVSDSLATAYLDRQFVHWEVPDDWRSFQDRIGAARDRLSLNATAAELLAGLDAADYFEHRPRSIFDDPDEAEDQRIDVMYDRDPQLIDLRDSARVSIERIIVHEALANGLPPIQFMELREDFASVGDDRALQYLDLPYDRGERPSDWDDLRDTALRIRQRTDTRDLDPLSVLMELEAQFPELDSAARLKLLERRLD